MKFGHIYPAQVYSMYLHAARWLYKNKAKSEKNSKEQKILFQVKLLL